MNIYLVKYYGRSLKGPSSKFFCESYCSVLTQREITSLVDVTMMGSVQTHTKESPLTELFSELKLIVLGFLDARSLHAMLWVNRAFHELIESKEGQIGLWLPLLSQHLRYDAEETRRLFPVWEENWKQGFVELISVPIIDSEGYNHGRFEVTDLRTAKMYNHVETYSNARAIKPILPHCSFYFEGFPPPPQIE